MNKYRKYLLVGIFSLSVIFIGFGVYIPAKAKLAQYLISNAWKQLLVDHNTSKAKPWRWADTYPVAKLTYKNTDTYILNSTSGEALSFGGGHYPHTALPASSGDSIIAGHRDTQFGFLQYIKIGDTLKIQNYLGQIAKYQVYDIQIINANKHKLSIDQTQNRLRIITCYPFDAIDASSPLRYVVYAKKFD